MYKVVISNNYLLTLIIIIACFLIYICYYGCQSDEIEGKVNYSKPKEEYGVEMRKFGEREVNYSGENSRTCHYEMRKPVEIPVQTVVVIHCIEERRQCKECDRNTPSCSKEPQRLYEMD
jgi:hypothetical protein